MYKTGYLWKKGGRIPTWSRKWMVLHHDHISFFKRPEDANPQGIIPLEGVSVINAPKEISKANAFVIFHPSRSHYLYAASPEDRNSWMGSIQGVIDVPPELFGVEELIPDHGTLTSADIDMLSKKSSASSPSTRRRTTQYYGPEGFFTQSELVSSEFEDQKWLVSPEMILDDEFVESSFVLLQAESSASWGPPPIDTEEDEIDEINEQLMLGMSKYSDDPMEEWKLTMQTYSRKLSDLGSKQPSFTNSFLKKRLRVLSRIHLAYARSKGRTQYDLDIRIPRKPSESTSTMKTKNLSLELATKNVVNTKPENAGGQLATLSNYLSDIPPVALHEKPKKVAVKVHEWLVSVIENTKVKSAIRCDALSVLLSLAIARGSLRGILQVISVLTRKANRNVFANLKVMKQLKLLAKYRLEVILRPMTERLFSASFLINLGPDFKAARISNYTNHISTAGAIATDGKYVYTHDTRGLLKVGTGFGGTLKGKVYGHNANFHYRSRAWLAVASGALYYRSASIEPATLIRVNLETLKEEGDITMRGTGSIKTDDNTAFDFTAGDTPVVSDGELIYLIKEDNKGSIYCDSYRPPMMRHVLSVRIQKAGSQSPSLSPACLRDASFYTNGRHLMACIPPWLSVQLNRRDTFVYRQYDLSNGALLDTFREPAPFGMPTCYDWINNVLWNYNSYGLEIALYANPGPATTFSTVANAPQAVIEDIAGPSQSDETTLAPEEVVKFLCQKLLEFALQLEPSLRETNTKNFLTEPFDPFSVQLEREVFVLLYALLDLSTSALDLNPSYLVPFIKILRLNLHRLYISKVTAAEVGLISKVDKERNLVWSFRQLLRQYATDPARLVPSKEGHLLNIIQQQASETLAVSLPVFYPTPTERAQLLQNLVQDVGTKANPPFMLLLNTLMAKFGYLRDLHTLVLPPGREDSLEDRMAFGKKFLNQLMELASKERNPAGLKLLNAVLFDVVGRCLVQKTGPQVDQLEELILYTKTVLEYACVQLTIPEGEYINPESFSNPVITVLLPSVLSSLALFIGYPLAANRVVQLIQRVTNLLDNICKSSYPEYPAGRIYEAQTAFASSGDTYYRVVETPHPYLSQMETQQTVTIPGANYLAIQFDHKSSSEPADRLYLYEPGAMKNRPIGKAISGSNLHWPQGRILIPGDSVVFHFKSRNASKSAWGFRAIVQGVHIPSAWNLSYSVNRSHSAIPPFILLEKLSASLSAKAITTLIRGERLTPDEETPASLIRRTILREGLDSAYIDPEEEQLAALRSLEVVSDYLSNITYSEARSRNGEDGKSMGSVVSRSTVRSARSNVSQLKSVGSRQALSDMQSLSPSTAKSITGPRSSGARSKSGSSSPDPADDIAQQDAEVLSFCVDMMEANAGTQGNEIAKWLSDYFAEDESELDGMSAMDSARFEKAIRNVGAAMLKHSGITIHLLKFIKSREWDDIKDDPDLDEDSAPKVIRNLLDIWGTMAEKIRRGVIQKHQQAMVRAYREEESTGRKSSTFSESARQSSYEAIVAELSAKSKLLLNVLPDPYTRGSLTNVAHIAVQVVELTLNDIPAADLRRVLSIRRERARSRARGLRVLSEMMESLSFASMSHDLAVAYSEAWVNDRRKTDTLWNHHFLEGLDGAGSENIRPIQKLFRAVQTGLSKILQSQQEDPVLQQACLIPWAFKFLPDDSGFLHRLDILPTLNNFILNRVRVVITLQGEGSSHTPYCILRKAGGDCFQCSMYGEEETAGDSFNAAETEYKSRLVLKDMSWLAFLIVGATICGPPADPSPSRAIENLTKKPIHATFFKLMTQEIKKGATSERLPSVLGLLHIVAESALGQSGLSEQSFISAIIKLLRVKEKIPYRSRRLAIELLKKVLPHVHPNLRIRVGSEVPLINALFDVLSDSLMSTEVPLLSQAFQREVITTSGGGSSAQIPQLPSRHQATPNPTFWDSKSSIGPGIVTGDDQTSVQYIGKSDDPELRNNYVVRTDVAVAESALLHYFEIYVENAGNSGEIAIGLYPVDEGLEGLPGEHNGSYGYHGVDGFAYTFQLEGFGEAYSAPFSSGDVIGQFWNKRDGIVYYTKNGRYLGVAFRNVFGAYHPVIGVASREAVIRTNFGHYQFKYDVAKACDKLKLYPTSKGEVWAQHPNTGDLVSLLRHLLHQYGWSATVRDYIVKNLSLVPKIFANGKPRSSKVTQEHASVLSTALVLGGQPDSFRAGARVLVDVGPDESEVPGRILDYDTTNHLAKVILDIDIPPRPKIFPVAALSIEPEPVDWEKLELETEHILALKPFFSPLAAKVIDDQNPSDAWVFYSRVRARCMRALSSIFQWPKHSETVDFETLSSLFKLAMTPIPGTDAIDMQYLEKMTKLVDSQIAHMSTEKAIRDLMDSTPAVLSDKADTKGKSGSGRRTSRAISMTLAKDIEKDPEQQAKIQALVKNNQLSKKELEEFTLLFRSYDADGSGSIHAREYFQIVHELKGGITEADVLEFKEMDLDRNNRVSLWEFLTFMIKKRRDIETDKEAEEVVKKGTKASKGVTHPGVRCSECREKIKGTRLRCVNEPSYNLCPKCAPEKLKTHNPRHIFLRAVRPFPTAKQATPELRSFLYPKKKPILSSDVYPEDYTPPDPKSKHRPRHEGVRCANCKQSPIKGDRYKDSNSKEDYSLCSKCIGKADEIAPTHHTFLLIRSPLPFESRNPIALYFPILYMTHLRFKDVKPGMWLQVSEKKDIPKKNWLEVMDKSIESTGLVVKVDSGKEQVLLKVYDIESSAFTNYWFPYKLLQYPETDLEQMPLSALKHKSIQLTNALAIMHARHTMMLLLGQSTLRVQFSLPALGGVRQIVEFFKATIVSSSAIPKTLGQSWADRSTPELRAFLARVDAYLKQDTSIQVLKQVASSPSLERVASKWKTLKKIGSRLSIGSSGSRKSSKSSGSERSDSGSNPTSPQEPPPPVAQVLAAECLRNLKDTARNPTPVIIEESSHPYKPEKGMIQKMVRIEGADALLVHFDASCSIDVECDALGFYRDITCEESFGAFNGTGFQSFPDVIIPANHFWMLFRARSMKSPWGYRFTVTPLKMKTSDAQALSEPDAEFGLYLAEWLLSLTPFWMEPIYTVELFDVLIDHLRNPFLIDRRLRIINILTQLLRRVHLFPKNKSPNPNFGKLVDLRKEFFTLHSKEAKVSHNYHSLYVRRLAELLIQVEILTKGKFAKTKDGDPGRAWLERAVKAGRILNIMVKKQDLPPKFIEEACVEAKQETYEEESAHPYPAGVAVSSTIQIPSAKSLRVQFDKQCHLLEGDYLYFSRKSAGKDDAGKFTGKFAINGPPIVIKGDTLIWTLQADINNAVKAGKTEWGFKFKVIPEYAKEDLHKIGMANKKEYALALDTQAAWRVPQDSQLVSFINSTADYKRSKSMLGDSLASSGIASALQLHFRHADPSQLNSYSLLSEMPVDAVAARFSVIKHLNYLITSLMPFVDFSPLNENWSLAYRLGKLRSLIMYEVKREWLSEYLKNSESLWAPQKVTIDRSYMSKDLDDLAISLYGGSSSGRSSSKSRKSSGGTNELVRGNRGGKKGGKSSSAAGGKGSSLGGLGGGDDEEEEEEFEPERSVFRQAFQQLHDITPTYFKRSEYPFEIHFVGEKPRSDPLSLLLSVMCKEVQTSMDLNLFLPVKNYTDEYGDNQEKFIPNPLATSNSQLAEFEFLGKIIGLAVRTRFTLELDFPSIIWKPLVGLRPDINDLALVDRAAADYLRKLRAVDGNSDLNEHNFSELIFETFQTQSSQGTSVELVAGGSKKNVTWANRLEFADLVESFRLGEFSKQVEAIQAGVISVLERHVFKIFTWQELEQLVCGSRGVDIGVLKRHTVYDGLRIQDSYVRDFWLVLESWSTDKKRLFINFIMARSRLPTESEWSKSFRLTKFQRPNIKKKKDYDNYLPVATPGSFTLELPPYSSKAILAEKLLKAITSEAGADESDYLGVVKDEDARDEAEVECPVS